MRSAAPRHSHCFANPSYSFSSHRGRVTGSRRFRHIGGQSVKRLLPLLAVAALIAVPAAAAHRSSAPPVMQKGKLIVAFGDPAPGFADGHVRGTNFVGGKGYEVD